MADIKEKLMNIIQNSVGGCGEFWAEVIADGLIANGVTVQDVPDMNAGKWISVKHKLPDDGEMVLVLVNGKPHPNITLVDAYQLATYSRDDDGRWIFDMWPEWMDAQVILWMPLPEPKKMEETHGTPDI